MKIRGQDRSRQGSRSRPCVKIAAAEILMNDAILSVENGG